MTDIPRLPNGRFPPGVSGGRKGGRKPKARTADTALEQAFSETITINEGGRKRRVQKLEATAKQIANEGATGKNSRAALAALQKATERKNQAEPAVRMLADSDQRIVERFIARLKLTQNLEVDNADGND